ncbi:MAG: D-alanine--D-alanine ligase [Bacteroidetes bacterium]|nr:D-alanine--D-alanine ligase [Bacteroidota bacterium]
MSSITIGVFFGGPSPEHEVSVISGIQALSALREQGSTVHSVYVSKSGRWFVGDGLDDIANYATLDALLKKATEVSLAPGPGRKLRLIPLKTSFLGNKTELSIDVAFLAFHGGVGENGAVQGLCESLGVPYTGSGVLASAAGMDKVVAKRLCRDMNLPVVDWISSTDGQWEGHEDEEMDRIEREIGWPAIVKPVHLGSSIGIARVTNRKELEEAMEEAFRYDASVMVEKCVANLREINCSVLGTADSCRVSVLEEPISADGTLSFQDKYMRQGEISGKGGSKSSSQGMASLQRRIPAPVPDEVADRVRLLAEGVFQALDGCGVARIDFLMDDETKEVWFNEINTIPGSLSFYLWEPSGVPFSELVNTLISLAVERFESRVRRVRSFDVNLLEKRAIQGLKGSKS